MPVIPPFIISILRRLIDNGCSAYLVGGCVRDIYLNRTPHDWDIATSASTSIVEAFFEKTYMTGERFGTVTVALGDGRAEVTTFRTDGVYRDGRHPETVEYTADIVSDLSRRDFTCNAMALSMTGELIDPFNGLNDINNCIIRCVGNPETRFSEDALRMLRAFRFSAQLSFEIESSTKAAVLKLAEKIKKISAERIRDELEKTLMSPHPEVTDSMIGAGLLETFIPRTHRISLNYAASLTVDAVTRWSAFCVSLLKAGSVGSMSVLLRKLRLDKTTVNICSAAVEILYNGFPMDRIAIKLLLAKNGKSVVRCAAVVYSAMEDTHSLTDKAADNTASVTSAASGAEKKVADFCASAASIVEEIISGGDCFSLDTLAINGRDLLALGHKPGRAVGKTLNCLLEHVIKNPDDNSRTTLLALALDV